MTEMKQHPDFEGLPTGRHTELSSILYCDFDPSKGMVGIHLNRAENMSPQEIFRSIEEGLRELAQYALLDERIDVIEGASLIVGRHPKLIEKLGFSVLNRGKKLEDSPLGIAHMSRKTLIEKYAAESPEV